jgi:sterol-4alpha-carboxylate 3-dehydrogenase (decarboxylating)
MSSTDDVQSLGKVVVIGGCGFLGHHIVNLIVSRHPQTAVSVLDVRTTNNRHASSTVSYHDGDITDYDAVLELFQRIKPDAVIHTASPTAFLPNEIHEKVNVGGTKNLLKAAQEVGVKAFVYTSSASVSLNPKIDVRNADETWPYVTGSAQPEYYTTTKAYAEMAVLAANRKPETFLTAAIRPAGIFGEGDVQIIPPMILAFKRGQTKFQVGDNNNTLFDWTYVENIAHGHLLALSALLATHRMAPTMPLDTERVDGEAFIISNGQPVYFWDFARAVWHEAGDRLPLEKVWVLPVGFAFVVGAILEWIFWAMNRKPGLTRSQVRYSTMPKYYNIDKAKKRLGYEPTVDMKEGVRRGVQYILAREKQDSEKKAQ